MERLETFFPGLMAGTVFREVGTPRTHRRFLGRQDGSYGPIPSRRPLGMLGMPLNRTGLKVGPMMPSLHACVAVCKLPASDLEFMSQPAVP